MGLETLETIKGFRNPENPDFTDTFKAIEARFEGGQQFVYNKTVKPGKKAPTKAP